MAKKHSTKRQATQRKLGRKRRPAVNYFEVPRPLWKRIKELRPTPPKVRRAGRPPLPDRLVLNAIWYVSHIKHRRRRGEATVDPCPIPGETQHPARRWVVERTFSWLAKRRSIRTRWCKKSANWLALLQFACAHILLNMAIPG